MQTFLPYPDFKTSVSILDFRRLGKQRVEAMQIINILEGNQITMGWINHPAVKMWAEYIDTLKYYYNCCISEWIKRGYKNTMAPYNIKTTFILPWWIDNDDFHRAMRARLIEKNEAYYYPLFPNDKGFNNGKYLWPVNETKSFKII